MIVPAVPPEGLTCTKEEHLHTEDCLDPEKWGLQPDGSVTEEPTDTEEPEKTDENDPDDPEHEAGFKALLEMTGEELYALTQADLLERNDEFMALTEREFESLNERMAALTATPAPRKAPHRAVPDAASSAGEREIPDLSGVTVSITDNVITTGQYEVTVTDTGNVLDGHALTYEWYCTKNGGAATAVAKRYFRLNGNVYSNLGDNDESLNLALDDGGLSDDITSVSYHAVLVVDGVEQPGIKATIDNEYYNKSVLNGSFEYPSTADASNEWPNKLFEYDKAPDLKWRTTASDKKIEIVRLNNKNKSSWFLLYGCKIGGQQVFVYPKSGDQYAEINAEADSALYQSVLTIPGTTMNWSLAHAKRPGMLNGDSPIQLRPGEKDTMYLCIMPKVMADNLDTSTEALRNHVKSLLGEQTTYNDPTQGIYIEKIQNGTTWGTYSGEYTVPNRQYLTSFFFISEAYEGIGVTLGNFLDNVWFAQALPPLDPAIPNVTLTKKLYGNLTEAEREQLRLDLKFDVYEVNGETTNLLKTVDATSLGFSWDEKTDGEGKTYYEMSKKLAIDTAWDGKTIRIVERGAEAAGYKWDTAAEGYEFKVDRKTTQAQTTFTNTYTANTCQLTVKKFVAPATTVDFNFTVSYTGATGEPKTETFSLTNGGAKTLTIPIGASVTITENNHDGYTVSMKDDSDTLLSGSDTYTFTIVADTTVNIHNTTGVSLPETGGASPYFFIYGGMLLMLSSVVTGYLLRRRNGKEGA